MPHPRAPWWMYLVAACAAVSFCLNISNDLLSPQGAGFSRRGYSLQVEEVVPGGPFEKAGVRPGDVLLAADGHPLRNFLDWDFLRTTLSVGKPFTLDVQRGAKTIHLTVVLPRRSYQVWDAGDFVIVMAFRGAQLLLLVLGGLIVFRRPDDLSARLAGWLFGSLGALNFPDYGWFALLREVPAPLRLLALGGLVLSTTDGVAWFCFFATFPRRFLTKPWHWGLAVLPGLALLPADAWFISWVYVPGRFAGLVSPAVCLALVAAVAGQELAGIGILIFNYVRLRDVNDRRRVGVLMVGAAASWAGGLTATFSGGVFWIATGWVLFLAFPFSFAYAILRHRLFDIRVMLRRGLQYALARGVLVSAVPAFAGILVLDLAVHGNQPLVDIMRERGWVYLAVGGLALVAQARRKQWLEGLDRRFFREHYDAQRLLRDIVEEIRQAGSLDRVAPRAVASIEAALHPEFAALLTMAPGESDYRSLASAPAGQAPPPLPADSKLVALARVLGKPLETPHSESGWLQQQLPHAETDFLRQARIDLLVPVAAAPTGTQVLLALGVKKSEEPYSREDQELLEAIAASLALLLEKPAPLPAKVSEAFEECPTCGVCYDTGSGHCAEDSARLAVTRLPRLLAGRYRLDRRRGRGGMGAVYEARDTALDRRVAVKVIRDELVGNAEAAERFQREARAAAGFTHPNVVTIYDFGIASDNRAFLVMELLEGAALREEMKRLGPLPAARVLTVMRGVCTAVEAAHRRQLVHRDLKPENIFLARSETGEVAKVLDFGIAKFLHAAPMGDVTAPTADTGTGALIGTVRYMSPEQLRGGKVGTGWDLWALAVVAYEALTGAHPFAGTTAAEFSSAILAGQFAPVSAHVPDAPATWQEFFSRALSLDATARPASAQELLAEIEKAV